MRLRSFVLALAGALTLAGCLDRLSGSSNSASGSGSNTGTSSYATPATGDTRAKPTAADASRLLQQASFGALPEDLDALTGSSIDAWLDTQFAKPQTPLYDLLRPVAQREGFFSVRPQFMSLILERMIRADDQLRQRVAFALSQIFVVSQSTSDALINQSMLLAHYYDMLGRNAFGNFRQLLEDVARHPAMGIFLSHIANAKEDPTTGKLPDENFAREIMQLFSIGLVQLNADGTMKRDGAGNPIPTYGQDEVLGMAKVFTGWSWGGPDKSDSRFFWGVYDYFEQYTLPMQSYPKFHSSGTKRIIDGYVIPAGGTPESDLAAALDRLVAHPNVGPFIALRLIQRLVTSNPSPGYVARVAAKFGDNGAGVRGDMKATIRAILTDPEARSASPGDSFGRLREPVQRFVNLARITRASAADGSLTFHDTSSVEWSIGQAPLTAPSVFNWYRPGYSPPGSLGDAKLLGPEFQIVNEYTAVSVSNVLASTIQHGFLFKPEGPQVKLDRWTALADRPAALVDDLDMLFCAGSMSAATKSAITTALTQIPTSMAQWQRERAMTALYLTIASPDYVIQK